MKMPKRLVNAALALSLPFGTSACVTTGSIMPKITNINQTDEASCLVMRVKGFNPGILPFLGFRSENMTKTDQVCVTRQTVGYLLKSNDLFLRTVGFETYKLLPEDAKIKVQ